MRWIKATEKLPEPYKWIPAKTWGGFSLVSYQKELDHFLDYWDNVISKEDIEWLDTEEPSFSLEDMKSAFKAGGIFGLNNANKSFDEWWEQANTIVL